MITLHEFIAEGFKLDKGGDRIRAVVEVRDFLVIVTGYAIYRVHEARFGRPEVSICRLWYS
jgi:hypothetical protein